VVGVSEKKKIKDLKLNKPKFNSPLKELRGSILFVLVGLSVNYKLAVSKL